MYAETSWHYHYVSVRDGTRAGLLLGPYTSRTQAEKDVERARRLCNELVPDSVWYGFGTTRLTTRHAPPLGKLNERLGLSIAF